MRNKFDADEEIEQKLNPHIIMRLFNWIKPYKGKMILSCVIMLLASAISLVSPYLIRMAIDEAIPNENIRLLVILSVILLLCIILSLQFTIPIENLISTLHFQATRDNSTRFYNENSFTELCTDKLSETPEGSKQALFFVDIDHYNYLLEYLGHDECEKIIVDVADSLRHVFPKTTLFSRISADRMILLTEISKEEKLDDVITNYCVDFQQQLFARFQEEYDVTASIGISVYPDQEKRYPLLLKFAEKSMNIVKKNGRNGFHIFDPENDLKDK